MLARTRTRTQHRKNRAKDQLIELNWYRIEFPVLPTHSHAHSIDVKIDQMLATHKHISRSDLNESLSKRASERTSERE